MPEDLALFFRQRDEAISGSVRLHSEFRVLNAQGEWRWCAADSISGFGADGQEVRCGYIADITVFDHRQVRPSEQPDGKPYGIERVFRAGEEVSLED